MVHDAMYVSVLCISLLCYAAFGQLAIIRIHDAVLLVYRLS